jgi:6-phosphogluconolactonase
MADQTLISKIQIPAQNIHRIHTELHPPAKAAESYEEMLREFFNDPEDKTPSAFDVILLGLGPDGHTASLFPQSPALEEKNRWVAAVDAPPSFPTRQRITMTFPLINRSRAAVFLVSGAEKSSVVEMILKKPDRARTIYPAARVNPRERLMWFIGKKE